nr:transposon Ty3-G Gag-Pol polyprotein [Tanacetum cinerariifolium]
KVAEGDRIALALFHLDGIALQWDRWYTKAQGPVTWVEFTKALLVRFGPTDYEDPSEALHRLKQSTTVVIYQEIFERLSNRVEGLLESFLVGCFIGVLKDEIRLEVKLKKPRRLVKAMGMARLVEEKNNLARKPFTPKRNVSNPGILGLAPTTRLALPAPKPIRRLSNNKARERREKGLYYYCDDKYTPRHKCSKPQFFMIGDAEETENENLTNDAFETQAYEVQGEISFHAISKTILPQTLRLPERIQNKDVVLLVDGGSTHNSVDQELVNRLGLQVDLTVNFLVVVANREKLACTGRVRNLSLVVQGCVISIDFFVLPVAACPIVLGVSSSHHKLQGLKASELSALKSHELMGICDAALLLQIISVLP